MVHSLNNLSDLKIHKDNESPVVDLSEEHLSALLGLERQKTFQLFYINAVYLQALKQVNQIKET